MGPFTMALVIFNSFIVATTLLLATVSNAQDDFETASTESTAVVLTAVRPVLNFNKLKDSLSGVNWNEYLAGGIFSYWFDQGVSSVDTTSRTVSNVEVQSNSSNNSYLDSNGPNVQFILFTRNYPPHNLKLDNHTDFANSGFNLSNPTKIIIHGFLSSTKEDIFILNRDAYIATGDYNVIGMDWSALCEFEYFTAMRGAQIAGTALGTFINWLIKESVEYNKIHLVGHSLGAHVAAMGADKVTGGKVGRITGLDPAGPGYNIDVPPMYRLDPTDATLVDIIHTNMRVLSLSQPQGHLDFYPNGGRFQPGCPDMYDIWTLGDSVECNHGRAYYYFAESIRNKHAFKSYRCPNVENANLGHCVIPTEVYMGHEETYEILDCSKNKAKVDFAFIQGDWQIALRRCNEANVSWYGLYYMKTNAQSPYSLT